MPVPVAVWAVLELVAAAITAYEVYDLAKTLYEGVDAFQRNVDAAKAEIAKKMEALKDEIARKIDEKTERGLLHEATKADAKQQREITKKAFGRGATNPLIQAAIQQKIPFRQIITMVCKQANHMPGINLRRKRGVQIKDLPQAKKKLLLEILAKTVEEIREIDDLDGFILVRMKQLMASLIFEFMDDLVDWASPLKAEVCFGPKFEDPLLEGTRLVRKGLGAAGVVVNPFYPLPHHQRGAFSADLAIPDYRKKPLTKDNLFALVEIKFEGDRIENKQFERYKRLSDECAEVKTGVVGKARTHGQKGVTLGCRISLFRFPEDSARDKDDDKHKQHPRSGKPAGRGGRR
ncbi:hypothetical protein [Azonexus sp.]|jgi:hypothetical protein|uniref:hypothetical protein n=1 Tax=Azonexus sp. TaxID=1872668 RepID=UPI002820168A|nr:hypothetical protein [Azonexus sp.]MDR1995541.1 hypothetical protein [Azonexus sp.]